MESIRALTIEDKTSLVKGELSNARGLSFTFLENGSIFTITHKGILINQVLGSPLDGGLEDAFLKATSEEAAV